MTLEEYRETGYTVIRLFGYLMGENDFPAGADSMDVQRLMRFAQQQGVTAIVGAALRQHGAADSVLLEKAYMAVRKSIMYDQEYRRVCERLDEAQIAYLPLKGVILKHLYPSEGLREMTDIDLLVDDDAADRMKPIMRSLGYQSESFRNSNHDVYQKKPLYVAEIHRTLFDPYVFPEMHQTAERIRGRLTRPDNRSGRLEASHEDFYLMIVLHAFKHYISGGTGLRILMDVYVYLKAFGDVIDFDAVSTEAETCGAGAFERSVRELSRMFFNHDSLSAEQSELLDELMLSHLYGDKKRARHRLYAASLGEGSKRDKLRYFMKRIAVPGGRIDRSPFFSRHPRLVPLLAVFRPIKAVVTRPKKLLRELKEVMKYLIH